MDASLLATVMRMLYPHHYISVVYDRHIRDLHHVTRDWPHDCCCDCDCTYSDKCNFETKDFFYASQSGAERKLRRILAEESSQSIESFAVSWDRAAPNNPGHGVVFVIPHAHAYMSGNWAFPRLARSKGRDLRNDGRVEVLLDYLNQTPPDIFINHDIHVVSRKVRRFVFNAVVGPNFGVTKDFLERMWEERNQ